MPSPSPPFARIIITVDVTTGRVNDALIKVIPLVKKTFFFSDQHHGSDNNGDSFL